MFLFVLLVVMVAVAFAAFPPLPWGRWHLLGYWPSGIVLLALLVLLVAWFLGRT